MHAFLSKMVGDDTTGIHWSFIRRRIKKFLQSHKRDVVVEVVHGGWKRLYYGSDDREWVHV